jgi:hypothetical protein
MKRFLLALTIGGALLFGCSQTQLDHALNNLSAYQCDNQQATLANLWHGSGADTCSGQ